MSSLDPKPRTSHSENVVVAGQGGAIRRLSKTDPNFNERAKDANNVAGAEATMTLREGLKLYPRAIAWSAALSTAIIMEGYDIILLGSLFAFPRFTEHYGERLPDGTYEIPAYWQAALANGAAIGEIIGLFINGIVSEKFGYRATMIGALAAVSCFIFLLFFAKDVKMLLIGEILCGIPWGVFQTLTTTYASEVCPTPLRAYLTTYVNLCWVIGQLIASGILRGMVEVHSDWSFKIPFALQWMWPLPIAIMAYFAPESPWWLVRQNRHEDAKRALARLSSPEAQKKVSVEETHAMIVHTNEIEKASSTGTNYWDCFRGVDLRRTEITCMVWIIQVTCGSGFMGYSAYFYRRAGLAVEHAFTMTMAQYGLGALGTFAVWGLMTKYGRRTLYLWGLAGMIITLVIIGGLGFYPITHQAAAWATGSMLLLFTLIYDVTVGPVCYSLVAEISSTRLRTKTIVLARNCYNVFCIINNFLIPAQINPGAWNWRGKAGFFWAGIGCLSFIWSFFRLPEPKDRSYAELDILFENKVSARKFSKTKVDLGSHGVMDSSSDLEYDEKPNSNLPSRSPSPPHAR